MAPQKWFPDWLGIGRGDCAPPTSGQARDSINKRFSTAPCTTQPCNQTCYICAPSNPSSGDPVMLKRLLPAAAAFLFLTLSGHAADSRPLPGYYDLVQP